MITPENERYQNDLGRLCFWVNEEGEAIETGFGHHENFIKHKLVNYFENHTKLATFDSSLLHRLMTGLDDCDYEIGSNEERVEEGLKEFPDNQLFSSDDLEETLELVDDSNNILDFAVQIMGWIFVSGKEFRMNDFQKSQLLDGIKDIGEYGEESAIILHFDEHSSRFPVWIEDIYDAHTYTTLKKRFELETSRAYNTMEEDWEDVLVYVNR